MRDKVALALERGQHMEEAVVETLTTAQGAETRQGVMCQQCGQRRRLHRHW